MTQTTSMQWIIALVTLLIFIAAPWVLPNNMTQLVDVMVFILIALSWDMLGGQMGYNSFGNILFFGVGMYLLASIEVWSGGFTLTAYNAAQGGNLQSFVVSMPTYLVAFFVGLLIIGMVNFLLGLIVGSQLLKMRGHYFAIGTLGLGVAAGEFAGTMGVLGAGSGMNFIQPPDGVALMPLLYFTGLAVVAVFFVLLRWLYSTRLGYVMNAIRDNEDKAEAMGLPTHNVKALSLIHI